MPVNTIELQKQLKEKYPKISSLKENHTLVPLLHTLFHRWINHLPEPKPPAPPPSCTTWDWPYEFEGKRIKLTLHGYNIYARETQSTPRYMIWNITFGYMFMDTADRLKGNFMEFIGQQNLDSIILEAASDLKNDGRINSLSKETRKFYQLR